MDNCAKFAGVAPSIALIPKGATTNIVGGGKILIVVTSQAMEIVQKLVLMVDTRGVNDWYSVNLDADHCCGGGRQMIEYVWDLVFLEFGVRWKNYVWLDPKREAAMPGGFPRMFWKVVSVTTCLAIFVVAPTELPFPLPGQDIQQCLSAFQSVSGCLAEVFKSFFSGLVGQFGPTCCKVIANNSTSYWPKLFPFITLSFPPFLTNSCTKAPRAAPSIATAQIPFPPLIHALSFPALPSQDIQQYNVCHRFKA
ncbi:hypothetical protein IFM89_021748 [Coptis chinensis]|uniref:Prolamin-like domain-containing protein n=1 Tax=Coptis chinensis TaxID=261450 RepID=A0A835H774_9MAGN|nr:hypothetical protein IFM89_021748 [Coptis chinensis]